MTDNLERVAPPEQESNGSRPTEASGTREARLEIANDILKICATYGRRFFSQDADRRERMESPRISRFEFRKGRLWYIDKYTEMAIFVHYQPRWRRGHWRGFSEGGTLQSMVKHLAEYIVGKVPAIDMRGFGPWPEWLCNGDLWGYGEDMNIVREKVYERCSQRP